MIISYPTGLYRSVLPTNPGDGGNVTFTISNTTPPRTNLIFPKIPTGVVDRGRQQASPSVTPFNNRQYLGDLIFSVSSAKRTQTGNNARQYELGQVLDDTITTTPTVDPMLVGSITGIQHDTNVFDYAALGISSAEQATVATTSLLAYTALTDQLNSLKQQRADAEITINLQQKLINDTTRTLTALTIVMQQTNNPDLQLLIEKLTGTRDAATVVCAQAVAAASSIAAQADVVLANLRSVAVILK